MKVEFEKHTKQLCQSYSSGMWCAFLSPDNKQAINWATCRDYLADAIRTTITKKPETIFGFSYNLVVPIDEENFSLIFTNDAFDISPKIELLSKFLNQIDDGIGWEKSVITKVENTCERFKFPVFHLKADKRIFNCPPLISFYTLPIRAVPYLTDDSTFENPKVEKTMVASSDKETLKGYSKIIAFLKENPDFYNTRVDENFTNQGIGTFHSNSGVQTFSNHLNKTRMLDYFPWQVKLK